MVTLMQATDITHKVYYSGCFFFFGSAHTRFLVQVNVITLREREFLFKREKNLDTAAKYMRTAEWSRVLVLTGKCRARDIYINHDINGVIMNVGPTLCIREHIYFESPTVDFTEAKDETVFTSYCYCYLYDIESLWRDDVIWY